MSEERRHLSETQKAGYIVWASLVASLLGLCAWIFPVCGFPVALTAMAGGLYGLRHSSLRTLSWVIIILSGVVLLLSGCNSLVESVHIRIVVDPPG